jgi:hypothetical protein
MMTRRMFCKMSVAALGLPTGAGVAHAQVRPFRIFIQREERWPDVVGLSQCVLGKMYIMDEFPATIAVPTQAPIGSTLELPWRNNLNEISRIPAGLFTASTRDNGDKGWRIQLDVVPGRKLVQIHLGNFPANTIGCILLGTGRAPNNGCAITGSQTALSQLRERYGSTERRIEILIRDA